MYKTNVGAVVDAWSACSPTGTSFREPAVTPSNILRVRRGTRQVDYISIRECHSFMQHATVYLKLK